MQNAAYHDLTQVERLFGLRKGTAAAAFELEVVFEEKRDQLLNDVGFSQLSDADRSEVLDTLDGEHRSELDRLLGERAAKTYRRLREGSGETAEFDP